jgi:stress response protein YsnF
MPDQERQTKDLRIPLHVEEISVSRCEIKKANVQVALVTGRREQAIDEELTRVRVEIERVPIDRTVEVAPPTRQGDVTIIPVVEEIVVVERRLVLKEEVRVRRVSTKEQYHETVVLRQQEAVVTGRSRTVSRQ